MTPQDSTMQKLIIDSINFTIGEKQYQIELDTGHIWDLSYGDFEETNIYLKGNLNLIIQDCLYLISQYEKQGIERIDELEEET